MECAIEWELNHLYEEWNRILKLSERENILLSNKSDAEQQ